jgi:hypothetical protein
VPSDSTSSLAEILERDLMARYRAPILGGKDLYEALGYPSADAFRQALSRGTLPVQVFEIEHRRGKYALIKDVAVWLASLREDAASALKQRDP